MTTLQAAAPNVKLEWVLPNAAALPAVVDGQIDLAHLGGEIRLPDGLDEVDMVPFSWTTFMRQDHPARASWGLEAWQTWPHVQLNIANGARSTLDADLIVAKVNRKIGALISEFASVGPLLARTDLLGTFPAILLAPDMAVYNLCPKVPPVVFPPFRMRFFWSARLANDPANLWIRTIVMQAYIRMHAEAEAQVGVMLGRVD